MSRRGRRWLLLLVALAVGAAGRPAASQQSPPNARLEMFVLQVARLWADGNATELAALAPAEGRIVLEIGAEPNGLVQRRHAAAALRELFAARETVSLRPTRITIAGGQPMRGFGELVWLSRSRGVTIAQPATLYIGTVWEGGQWRVGELRLLR